jgi:methionine sulfoxide reductase heme-binding subunit
MPAWAMYALLASPAAFMLCEYLPGDTTADELLGGSGETSARFLIATLAVSPLRRLFPKARLIAWLAAHRRALGVSAFAYALLHVMFYVVDMGSLQYIVAELGALGIWTGWLAFAIFVPLAATSNNRAARRLGRAWHRLHRFVYVAAIATLVHWIYVHNDAVTAWLHFVPLILLEVTRVRKTQLA